ncbi:MAG: tetratricopeptide repeat protein [Vulcanimicrobiaceae bacterium]
MRGTRLLAIVLSTLVLGGCSGGIVGAIVATRNNQGDLEFQNGHYTTAAEAYRLAIELAPNDAHARSGLAAVQLRIAAELFRSSKFDEALQALAVAAQYDPQSVRLAQLKTEIEDARTKRQIVISNYPAYHETGLLLRRSYLQLKEMDATIVGSLVRFDYTYDPANLSDAIRQSYELNEESSRLANRLIAFRALVESGAPDRSRDLPPSAGGSLLPLP